MMIRRGGTLSGWCAPGPEGYPPPLRRRALLQWTAALLVCAAGSPPRARAAGTSAEFDLVSFAEVLAALGGQPVEEAALQIRVPDAVEDGGFVPVEVSCDLPDTRSIYLLAESNPYPLVARYDLPEGTQPFLATRIRVQASCRLYAVARTGDQLVWDSAYTRITRGGCGD